MNSIPKTPWSRLELVGEYVTQTPLRIGSAESNGQGGLALDTNGLPWIPASTFRGVLRATVESLLRSLDSEARAILYHLQVSGANGLPLPIVRRVSLCCDSVDKSAADAHYQGCLTDAIVASWQADPLVRPHLDRVIVGCTCLACRVFGASWIAGRVRVNDLPLIPDSWDRSFVTRGGVTIRRDTGTLLENSAYTREALPAGVRFRFRLFVENATFAEQGLILLGLRAFQKGMIGLGADQSRGFGRGVLEMDWWNCRTIDAANLIDAFLSSAPTLLTEKDADARIAAFSDMINAE